MFRFAHRSCLSAAFLAIAGLVGLAAGGCAKHELPVQAATKAHTLLLGNFAEPADLDPPVLTAYTDMNIALALFEGLTAFDEKTSQAVPAAAGSWDVAKDGLTWTFHLRAGLAWSNGEPLVADDFVQSFRRVVAPAMAMENASYLFALKNAEAINAGKIADLAQLGASAPDAHTLVLTLERPTPHLPLLAALTPWLPINPRVLAKFGAMEKKDTAWTRPGNLVGNGPFMLEAWLPHAKLVVVKNPHYWDAANTRLAAIEFHPIENPVAEEDSFRSGQLHITFSLPISRIAAWRERDPAKLRIDPFLQTVWIAFNAKRAPFDDGRVRRAFALAIDRDAIARSVLGGSRPAAHASTPPGTNGFTARARIDTDYEQARALLAAAGHAHGAGLPPLELQVRNDELQPKVAEAIQAMWEHELGVRVSLAPMEQKTWLQNQASGTYSISTYAWVGDYPDPLTFLNLFTSTNGNNWTGWSDQAYDGIIDAATVESDPARRDALFQEAEAKLLAACPLTPIYHGAQAYLIDPAVKHWEPSLLGFHRYKYVELQSP